MVEEAGFGRAEMNSEKLAGTVKGFQCLGLLEGFSRCEATFLGCHPLVGFVLCNLNCLQSISNYLS